MLAVARGLMSRPKMLLMDEPCQGLSPITVKEVGKTIRSLKESGLTILLVEHNVSIALGGGRSRLHPAQRKHRVRRQPRRILRRRVHQADSTSRDSRRGLLSRESVRRRESPGRSPVSPPAGHRSSPRVRARRGCSGSRMLAYAACRVQVEPRCREWSREPRSLASRERCRYLLRQPRHVGDALRRGARQGRRHALCARPRGDGGDRMRRRLRAHDGQAGRDLAPLRTRARERHRQCPQRAARRHPDGEHRRRPCDLAPAPRLAAHLRHRGARPDRVALGAEQRIVGSHRLSTAPPRCRRR